MLHPSQALPSRVLAVLCALLLAAFALVACGDDDSGDEEEGAATAVAAVDTPTCTSVEFGGEGEPDALVVSDLPMSGESGERSRQQVEAIRLLLEQRDWQAGDLAIGYQACDDAPSGEWDARTCRENATAYAETDAVLGVIGTYNSGCAAEEIPILGEAELAMVSPGNTAVCLTQDAPGCEDGQPGSLYPGERNYARVIPNDAFQGAGLAQFAADQGIERPFVLYAADDPTSTGQADNFRGAAEQLGLEVAGYETWDPEAREYAELFEGVGEGNADAIVLAGLTEQNGATLIEDKVDALGDNDEMPLIAFDGFAQQATIDEAGRASRGMLASVPGSDAGALEGEGAEFVTALEERLGGGPVEGFAPIAGEAAGVLLDAIAAGGDDRAAVAAELFGSEGAGILGEYTIDETGDPSVGPITILRAGAGFEPDTEISADAATVEAARAGG
jgi:branched-chain amino acid transport system substrate-binding protein